MPASFHPPFSAAGRGGAPLRRGECRLCRRNAPPIFFSILPKRKWAVHGPKEKNAPRWECPVNVRKDEARGVDSAGMGDRGCPGLLFSLPLPGCSGAAAAEQEETGVRNLQTPACTTARAETCLESGSLPHRETFFLFHRARRIFFLMSQKETGGCIPRAASARKILRL